MNDLYFLNKKDLIGINGGKTSFAYDVGTFLRVAFYSNGAGGIHGASAFGFWYSLQ